jgi:hypothetical protein
MDVIDFIFQLLHIINLLRLIVLTPPHSPCIPFADYAHSSTDCVNSSIDCDHTFVDCTNFSIDYANKSDDCANTLDE